jgi:hypothetical protein
MERKGGIYDKQIVKPRGEVNEINEIQIVANYICYVNESLQLIRL